MEIIDTAAGLMRARSFVEALDILNQVVVADPSHWNAWYLAGQCYRFLGDADGAVQHLSRAADLRRDDPSILLALGIAFQQGSRWNEAIASFRRAIEIDEDFELAYNSLALTQKKRGELDKALHNYDAGVRALGRRIAKSMINSRRNPILKNRETAGRLWVEYASYAAVYIASAAGDVGSIAFPTGEMAVEEERTERHEGLYWTEVMNEKQGSVRLFLPNYFNTFLDALCNDLAYANMIGNRGTVLDLLGREDEARIHISEATEIQTVVGRRHAA